MDVFIQKMLYCNDAQYFYKKNRLEDLLGFSVDVLTPMSLPESFRSRVICDAPSGMKSSSVSGNGWVDFGGPGVDATA